MEAWVKNQERSWRFTSIGQIIRALFVLTIIMWPWRDGVVYILTHPSWSGAGILALNIMFILVPWYIFDTLIIESGKLEELGEAMFHRGDVPRSPGPKIDP